MTTKIVALIPSNCNNFLTNPKVFEKKADNTCVKAKKYYYNKNSDTK